MELLKAAFRYVLSRKPFKFEAICVLPDHMHCIWTMQNDCNYSIRWQMIKMHFSRLYRQQHPDYQKKSIWQPRYWEHVIRNQRDFDKRLDYLHFNPVKHGLVESVNDWPYSSYSKYLAKGYYESAWGDVEPESIMGLSYE